MEAEKKQYPLMDYNGVLNLLHALVDADVLHEDEAERIRIRVGERLGISPFESGLLISSCKKNNI